MKNRVLTIIMILTLITGITNTSFTATAYTAADGEIYLEEDFSNGYQLETAYTYDGIAEVNSDFGYTPEGWNKSSAEFFKVKKIDVNNSDKGNYLEIGLQGSGKHAYLASEIGDFETGTLVSEMKIRINGARYISDVFVFFDANDEYKAALGATNSTDISIARSALDRLFNTNVGNLTKDSDGFYNLRCVWSRNSANSPWYVYVYDMWTDELAYKNETVDADFTPSAVMFYSSYYTSSTDSAEDTIDLASLMLYYMPLPKIVSGNCDNAAPHKSSYLLNLNTSINETPQAVIVKKDDESVTIGTECIYLAETKQLSLALKSYLEYDTEYIIKFSGVGIEEYSFTTESAPLTVESEVMSYLDIQNQPLLSLPANGSCTAVCDISVSGAAQARSKIVAILIAYDSQGRICYTNYSSFAADDLSEPFRVKLDIKDASRVNDIHTLIWEKTGSYYQSIIR